MASELTKEEIQANRASWIEALESGEYEQGMGALCTFDRTEGKRYYCCLGVACEVFRKRTGQGYWDFSAPPSHDEDLTKKIPFISNFDQKSLDTLPREVAEYFGVTTQGEFYLSKAIYADNGAESVCEWCLTNFNDSGVSFEEIVRLLREEEDQLKPTYSEKYLKYD